MADSMSGLQRTHYCGEVRLSDVGKRVVVGGFVQKTRELGNLTFIDLRDRTGVVQLSFDDSTDRAVFEKAGSCRAEYVLMAAGVLRERESKNPDLPTGDVELYVDDLRLWPRRRHLRLKSARRPTRCARSCGCGTAIWICGGRRCRET